MQENNTSEQVSARVIIKNNVPVRELLKTVLRYKLERCFSLEDPVENKLELYYDVSNISTLIVQVNDVPHLVLCTEYNVALSNKVVSSR